MIILPSSIDCTWSPLPDLAILRFCLATGKPRNPRFERESRKWLLTHPCAVTGEREGVEVHHIRPFHLFPELEMDPENWIALLRPWHLYLGHAGNWTMWNPDVRQDAARFQTIRKRKATA